MSLYFLPDKKLQNFIKLLSQEGETFWTRKTEILSNRENRERISIEKYDEEKLEDYVIPGFRAYDNFKKFLLPPRFKVAEYPEKEWEDIKIEDGKKVLIGLKGCDVAGLSMLDKVFLEDPDFVDPFYRKNRESLVIVSSDCTRCGETCFCNLLGNNPYATGGFDINLSEISGGYIIESDSSIGDRCVTELSLDEATEEQVEERDKKREKVTADLREQNAEFEKAFKSDLAERVDAGYESDSGWALGSTCVSCGACTNVCPVCYCFTLFDRKDKSGEKSKRFMVWDSCQYKGFAQMAGGLNPRFSLMERFKNRYYHKFFRFKDRYDDYKCTGCGRCVDDCPGEIDMREVLTGIKIEEEVK